MEKKKERRRMADWMAEYAYAVTLLCVLGVIASCALYTHQMQSAPGEGVQAAAGAMEIETRLSEATAAPQVTPLPTIAPLFIKSTLLTGGAQWPVDGDVMRQFDAQELVFFEALGAFAAHTGLDIAGEAGEEVSCAADGMVKSAVRDGLWGWRVEILQEDGRTARYSGLEVCYAVPGERIRRGEALGTLMERIPIEAEMAPHLHMEVTRDGVLQDPMAMLEEK